jgi:hypothetical protein
MRLKRYQNPGSLRDIWNYSQAGGKTDTRLIGKREAK